MKDSLFRTELLVISITLKESYKSVIIALFKASFSSNNDAHYFSPVDKSSEHFLLRLYFLRAKKRIIMLLFSCIRLLSH